MSKFTLAAVEEIAARAVRQRKARSKPSVATKPDFLLEARSKPPVLVQPELLRDALLRAEIAHDIELERREREFAAYCRDRQMFEQHDEFHQLLSAALKHWREMQESTKNRLIHYTQNHLQTIEQARDVIPLARLRKRCDDTLAAIDLAANQGASFLRGRRSGTSQSVPDQNKSLRPLYAFAAELKAFWKASIRHERFGQQFHGIVPLSAASKLMVESAELLKVKYEPAGIQTVMRMLASKPVKTFPDDEFMVSFRELPDF